MCKKGRLDEVIFNYFYFSLLASKLTTLRLECFTKKNDFVSYADLHKILAILHLYQRGSFYTIFIQYLRFSIYDWNSRRYEIDAPLSVPYLSYFPQNLFNIYIFLRWSIDPHPYKTYNLTLSYVPNPSFTYIQTQELLVGSWYINRENLYLPPPKITANCTKFLNE